MSFARREQPSVEGNPWLCNFDPCNLLVGVPIGSLRSIHITFPGLAGTPTTRTNLYTIR